MDWYIFDICFAALELESRSQFEMSLESCKQGLNLILLFNISKLFFFRAP